MSYIGNKPATSFETVQKQISTSNSGTTITLDRAVTSVQDILLTIDAVVQSYDNYSVSGTTLTVGGTLNNNRVEILYVGRTMQSVDPTDDSVSASKIKTDAVTTAKVQNDAITVDKLNLISTSSVPSLEAKGDGGSQDGYIQLNCSQNSHGIKLKSPNHASNSSYTLTFPGTDPATDKIMQTDSSGNLSFIDTPSGNLVKLLSSSQSNGNATQIYGTNIFNSTYDNYLLTGFIAPTQDSEIRFRWTTGGGTTQFTNADYNWVSTTRNIDSSHGTGNSYGGYHGETYFPIAFEDINADNNSDAANFHMLISDPSTSILSRPYITGTSTYRSIATAKLYTERFGFGMEGNPSATGFILYMSAGNIRDHSICVYGYKK